VAHKLAYGTVREGLRRTIHVVRVLNDILKYHELAEIAEKMCERALSKYGEQAPVVVVIQGGCKETLRLFGERVAVSRVRTAMFNTVLTFTPIELDRDGSM
jgi:hypothetical protein